MSSCYYRGYSCGHDHTNLQIPVDDPINMAVMDTLEDLLYAVARRKKSQNDLDGSNRKSQTRKAEKKQKDGD